jgi:hypothetical protein
MNKGVLLSYLLLTLIAFCSSFTHANDIKVLKAKSTTAVGHYYFIDLLRFSLEKSSPDYLNRKVKILAQSETSQGRDIRLLINNDIDVIWTGTDNYREKE